jgi:hypothetical protein
MFLICAVLYWHSLIWSTEKFGILEKNEFDHLILMDGDGEDRPAEIRLLAEKALSENNISVVAKRIKRSEGFIFKLLYYTSGVSPTLRQPKKKIGKTPTGHRKTPNNQPLSPGKISNSIIHPVDVGVLHSTTLHFVVGPQLL